MLTTSTNLPGSFAPERPLYNVRAIVPGRVSVLYLTFVGTRKYRSSRPIIFLKSSIVQNSKGERVQVFFTASLKGMSMKSLPVRATFIVLTMKSLTFSFFVVICACANAAVHKASIVNVNIIRLIRAKLRNL